MVENSLEVIVYKLASESNSSTRVRMRIRLRSAQKEAIFGGMLTVVSSYVLYKIAIGLYCIRRQTSMAVL